MIAAMGDFSIVRLKEQKGPCVLCGDETGVGQSAGGTKDIKSACSIGSRDWPERKLKEFWLLDCQWP